MNTRDPIKKSRRMKLKEFAQMWVKLDLKNIILNERKAQQAVEIFANSNRYNSFLKLLNLSGVNSFNCVPEKWVERTDL